MVLTYIKKIRHSMFCVTGVYLSDICFFIFYFALECESSEHFLFLLRYDVLYHFVHAWTDGLFDGQVALEISIIIIKGKLN